MVIGGASPSLPALVPRATPPAGTSRPAGSQDSSAATPDRAAGEAEPTRGAGRNAAPGDPQAGREGDRLGREQALSESDRRILQSLRNRDRQVRSHEQAHLAAAGGLAKGGPSFTFATGPDGRRYATGGEVQIDTSPVPNDPQATIRKAQQVRRAAQAPADPSSQDRRVAAQATVMERQARAELLSEGQRLPGTQTEGSSGASDANESAVVSSPARETATQCSICGGQHGAEAHVLANRQRIDAAIQASTPAQASPFLDTFA